MPTLHPLQGGVATGSTGTTREYIWLPATKTAPTRADVGEHPKREQERSRTTIDRPLAVVDAVNTVSPQTWWVSVDHLNRPVRMTTAAKASVWDAVWQPWGGVQAITGSASLDARFPGQWFQAETGLHYNWHRSYDPTLGRYTQPDPLGFVDGPSVYGYAGGSPGMMVDPLGLAPDRPKPPIAIDPRTGQVYPTEPVPTKPGVVEPDLRKQPSPLDGALMCEIIYAADMLKCNRSPMCLMPYGLGFIYRAQCIARATLKLKNCLIGVHAGGG